MSEAESSTPPEPRALIAIDHSAQLCARAFPYLSWRYGEAGLTALRDDNAQLMTLARTNPDGLGDAVEWIRRNSALRGQPSWILEVDLEYMARATQRWLPELAPMCGALRYASKKLAARRRQVMSEGRFLRCGALFEEQLGAGSGRLWHGFGRLLASAVADERRGDMQVVVRVCAWAMDERRFGEPWREAVSECVQQARQL